MTIKDEISLSRSKLLNRKEHLEALLRKRERLNYEIATLKKSLRKLTRNTVKNNSALIQESLKTQEIAIQEGKNSITLVGALDPELQSEIFDFDETVDSVLEVLEE